MNLNRSSSRSHSVCRLFTVVLLGLFLIFLLVMLLFSAQAYRTATKGTQQNNNLYTASSYISVKFHQHDSSQSIFTDTVDGSPALCMTDTVNDQQYITYIYLKEQHLKELFTAAGNTPSHRWVQILPVSVIFRFSRRQTDSTVLPLKIQTVIPAACCCTLVLATTVSDILTSYRRFQA